MNVLDSRNTVTVRVTTNQQTVFRRYIPKLTFEVAEVSVRKNLLYKNTLRSKS